MHIPCKQFGKLFQFGRELHAPEEIREIHIVLQEIGRMVTEPREAKYRPRSAAVAKFSLPFVVGTAVVYGAVGLDSFTAERLSDPAVSSVADRVVCEIDPSLTKEQNKHTDITIRTARGDFHRHLEHPLGCVEHPMGRERMRRKFFDTVISQSNHPYLENLILYNKALEQRNRLLKQDNIDLSLLEVYDAQLCQYAPLLYGERRKFIDSFIPVFQAYYRQIAGSAEEASLVYRSQLADKSMEECLRESGFLWRWWCVRLWAW